MCSQTDQDNYFLDIEVHGFERMEIFKDTYAKYFFNRSQMKQPFCVNKAFLVIFPANFATKNESMQEK